ncbi:isopeptide-forming domain-containing fimbrial protein [Compostimonas suwonensis]|uniref:Putative repeat protein (TIGR01451 family)/fimbrial isopeptide formation D2 family protein n=1 Tax=Compostimonas suwonensis TaxID=1048394 RepID=A0A2M9C4R2_9MICO|nr:isopeptide-forming domain-containing fimbrial protein [Compostimonas suwonensis]PJJ65457.1 putative repeat protein (TIGR01451 family)/fimbrial isopeptide formation D2 family protein [Compostimonas suwonensis]
MESRSPLSRATAVLSVIALTAASLSIGLLAAPAAQAAQVPTVSLTHADPSDTGKDFILAGEQAHYELTVQNTSDAPATPWYNLAVTLLVPNGIAFADSVALGAPEIYTSGQTPLGGTPIPAGFALWVWEDISDLPVAATRDLDLTVTAAQPPVGGDQTADAAVFPVGSDFDLTAASYASTNARFLPVFNGSTGVRTPDATAATQSSAPDVLNTEVRAIRVTKTEPSPESELMRGVHDRTTVYTITVENTSEGPTDDTVLVDYLPAGLEFLGCGATDNSTWNWPTESLEPGAAVEYPGAPRLTAVPAVTSDCPIPVAVDTVEKTDGSTGFPADLANGVYTKVTWNLGTLEQGDPSTGTPSQRIVDYAVGIPDFANTMTWQAGTTQPSAESLGQQADLDNNNGDTTRQSVESDAHTDGQVYRNVATATGDYAGVIRTGADREATDDDDEIVYSMDLRVLKSVDTQPADGEPTEYGSDAASEFITGGVAKYTLTLRTSEYTDSSDIVLTDTIPNGLCPVVPAGTPVIEGPFAVPTLDGGSTQVVGAAASDYPADCALGAPVTGDWTGPVTGGTITGVAYEETTGQFYLTFSAPPMSSTDPSHSIVYPVLMRSDYEHEEGATTSLDRFVNSVVLTATTTSIPALGEPVTETIADDSSATIVSGPSAISKKVLPRDVDVSSGCPAAGYEDELQSGFVLGDLVCFELTVDFATDVDTRNPTVTDMLPSGIAFEGTDAALLDSSGTPIPGATIDVTQNIDDGRITWEPYTSTLAGDQFVPIDSSLLIHVWGTVTSLSVDPSQLDKPENLMKFTQENVEGEVYFLRDQAEIEVESGLQLLKGVETVDDQFATGPGCTGSEPDCDHVPVVEGDQVGYRIDLSDAPADLSQMSVEDELPEGIPAAAVGDISDGGAVEVRDGRTFVVWNGLDLGRDGERTVSYIVTIPEGLSVSSSLVNTATITSYDYTTNTGESVTAVPGVTPGVPAQGTSDDSDVYLPDAAVAKRVVSTELDELNNNGNGTGTGLPTPQFVAGEFATYEYSVTIPAHTSVVDGVLSDRRVLSTSASMSDPRRSVIVPSGMRIDYPAGVDGAALGFTLNPTGELVFPPLYDNTGDDDQVFTIRIVVFTGAFWNDGDLLHNEAVFTSTGASDATAQAIVEYIEPDPVITKTADVGQGPVVIGQTITYTLAVTNPDDRPTSYDTVVTDCVPADLTTVGVQLPSQGSAAADSPSADCAAGETLVTWTVGQVLPGASLSLQYTAVVSPEAAAGDSYANTASLVGYTLPEEPYATRRGKVESSSTATIVVENASITKAADREQASIGDTVGYTVTTSLPANVNFYQPTISDEVPAGLRVDPASIAVTGDVSGFDCGVIDGDIECALPGGDDIASATVLRTVTLSYRATVVAVDEATPSRGDGLDNTAAFDWSTANTGGQSKGVDAEETITVTEPELQIAKTVDGQDAIRVTPGDGFSYAVTVTNPDVPNASTAYDVVVTDTVPTGVSVHALTPVPGVSGTVEHNGDGTSTITWTIASIGVGDANAVVLPYTAGLAASADLGTDTQTNTVGITEYFSTPDADDPDRREYTGGEADAEVTPEFPHVTVAKTVADGFEARVGEAFPWTVTIENTGDAAAALVTATDTLPAGWGSPQVTSVTRGGAAVDPADWGFAADSLVWTFDDVQPADDVIVVQYTATPTTAAYTAPGAGVGPLPFPNQNPHENSVAIVAEDGSGAEGNADGPYAGGPADDDAYLRATDLTIEKTLDTTGTVWVGDEVTFTVTAVNNGPQQAEGVTVVDQLPAGLSFAGVEDPFEGVSGDWSCDVVGDSLDCELDGSLSADEGSNTASFTVTAKTLPWATTAATAESVNHATIATTTPETDDDNNSVDEPVTVTAHADLAIAKAYVQPETPIAGEPVSWSVLVHNNGPSISAAPITVTDTLGEGIDAATATASGDGWSCAAPDVDARTITCVSASDLPSGQDAAAITVTTTLDPGLTPTDVVTNDATVTATTPDRDDSNDTDEAQTQDIDSEADLSLVKSLASETLPAGQTGRYRIAVANAGPSDAIDVTVADTLPAGLSYAGGLSSDDGAVWTLFSDTDGALVFQLQGGVLEAGASTAFEFDVDVASSVTTAIENSATVDSGTTELDPDDNTGEVTVDPTVLTNLAVEKSYRGEGPGRIGDPVTFRVTVTNEGPADAANVSVSDILPDGRLTFAGVEDPITEADGWTCAIDGDAAGCTLDAPLSAIGGTNVASFSVTAIVLAPAYPRVENTATVATTTEESDESDNSSTATVEIPAQVDLSIEKTLDGESLVVGRTADYVLTVTNNGPTENPGPITVSDVLPPSLELVGTDTESCELVEPVTEPTAAPTPTATPTGTPAPTETPVAPGASGGAIDCVVDGPLAAGDSFTITVTVNVLPGAYPSVENTATVSTESEDLDPQNDSSTITSPVTPDIRVSLTKTLATVEGDEVFWKLEVTSIGLNDAVDGFSVVDTLPASLSFVRSIGEGFECELSGQVVDCEYSAELAVGESASVLLETTSTAGPGQTVTNTAVALVPGSDQPGEAASSEADYTVPTPLAVTGPRGFAVLVLAGASLLAAGLALAFVQIVRRRNAVRRG